MIKLFDKKSGLYIDLRWFEVNREIDSGMMSFNIGLSRNQYLKSTVKMDIDISYLGSFLELVRDWGIGRDRQNFSTINRTESELAIAFQDLGVKV
jgi:hypothetical protein